ncbi:mechanosensitive ion channel family protein [Desulfovibrio gilichinskyi]|uniref:Mechanosensitive ion channel n=1 Tax=Desulfovibrio gilichinskyi TaxID=1519643 RepID=A0A1X7DRV5_9BACT|nr:mechanosensitive ion channel domain-containing protein [Desulfovibrio gilichinskyi]SMF20406.1 Mechanosensitive ion channel [Desulfovibrio gilichinskyi]
MTTYKKNTITLVLIVISLLYVSLINEVHAESTKQTWTYMLEGIEHDINEQNTAVQNLQKKLPEMLEIFDHRIFKAKDRLDQLKLLRGLAKQTPWSYRTILLQLEDLKDYVLYAKKDLLVEKNRLKKIKKDIDLLSELNIENSLELNVKKELLTKTIDSFKQIRNLSSVIKKELDVALTHADETINEISQNKKITTKYYAGSMESFYFQEGPSLLDSTNWQDISYAFEEWQQGHSKFYYPLFVWVNWTNFMTYMAIIAFACWIFLRQAVKILLKRSIFANHSMSAYNFGLIMLSLGAGIFIARQVTLFTSNQITGLVWSELITLGIIICARNFLWANEKTKPAKLMHSPMFTLWCLMTAGDILHMLTIPVECIGTIWIFFSLIALVVIRENRKKQSLKITKTTSKITMYILALCSVLTLFGLGTQAMMSTQLWFLFLVTLQICNALKTIMVTSEPSVVQTEQIRIENESESKYEPGPETGRVPPINEDSAINNSQHNHMIQLMYPLSISVIIFFFIAWATAYMGGIPFAKFVFRHMDIKIAGAAISIKSLFYILILFFTSRLILFWLKTVVSTTSIAGRKMESALAHTFSTIGSYLVWVFFILSSLYLLGIPMATLTWIASGLSIGIGFGLKDIVSNFVSGLIILFGGSIKKGDILQRNKIIGRVEDVSIRNTTMRALDNSMVIIPNSSFLKGEIVNLNFRDSRIRVAIPITLVPGSKIEKAKKIMLKTVRDHPKVMSEPEPSILFKRFGNFGLEFEIYFWVRNFEDQYPTESEIVDNLDQALQDKKITIAFRGIKVKYKPKGDEAAQINAQREALKEKRRDSSRYFKAAALRRHRNLLKLEREKPQ